MEQKKKEKTNKFEMKLNDNNIQDNDNNYDITNIIIYSQLECNFLYQICKMCSPYYIHIFFQQQHKRDEILTKLIYYNRYYRINLF